MFKYLTIAAFVLILITSAGIYGFLSSAYQETANRATIVDQQVLALEGHGAFRYVIAFAPCEHVGQRGLAGARGPHDRGERAVGEPDADAAEGVDDLGAHLVKLGDALDVDDKGSGGPNGASLEGSVEKSG